MEADWTAVIPAPGQIMDVAKALLALADDPRDVRTDGNGSEFRIPPYLADRYNAPAPRKRVVRTKKEGDE